MSYIEKKIAPADETDFSESPTGALIIK